MNKNQLQLVPLPLDDPEYWKRLMNLLLILEKDRLFEWLREVRKEVIRAEAERADRERAA